MYPGIIEFLEVKTIFDLSQVDNSLNVYESSGVFISRVWTC